MNLPSLFPEHICKVLGAIMEPDEDGYGNHVHPKFIKWMTVARFKYDCPKMILQIAERCRTHGKFYYDGMTNDSEMVTVEYDFVCPYHISWLFQLMTDYLESVDLHCHSITVRKTAIPSYTIQFTFTQSPTQ